MFVDVASSQTPRVCFAGLAQQRKSLPYSSLLLAHFLLQPAQEIVCRRKGKLAHAHLGVLRVRASRECPPSGAEWPTPIGRWAFKVMVPIAVALERQSWMEKEKNSKTWLPNSQPGLCRQCALGDRSCVHLRLFPRKVRDQVSMYRVAHPLAGLRGLRGLGASENG